MISRSFAVLTLLMAFLCVASGAELRKILEDILKGMLRILYARKNTNNKNNISSNARIRCCSISATEKYVNETDFTDTQSIALGNLTTFYSACVGGISLLAQTPPDQPLLYILLFFTLFHLLSK